MTAMKEADEEGWTLVTKLNKKRRARGRVDPKAAEKSSNVSPDDFYAFKKEEAKLQRIEFYLKCRRNSKILQSINKNNPRKTSIFMLKPFLRPFWGSEIF